VTANEENTSMDYQSRGQPNAKKNLRRANTDGRGSRGGDSCPQGVTSSAKADVMLPISRTWTGQTLPWERRAERRDDQAKRPGYPPLKKMGHAGGVMGIKVTNAAPRGIGDDEMARKSKEAQVRKEGLNEPCV